MDAMCPNCGEDAVPADNYDDDKPNIPERFQTVINRWRGSFTAYKCLHPDCSCVFLVEEQSAYEPIY